MQTFKSHAEMVSILVKPGQDIIEFLSSDDAHLWHMATGVSGEACELLDAVKKIVIYKKEPDLANIIEELGDLEFYMEGIRQLFGLSRDTVIAANIEKLSKRYSEGKFTNKQAQDRADKVQDA